MTNIYEYLDKIDFITKKATETIKQLNYLKLLRHILWHNHPI